MSIFADGYSSYLNYTFNYINKFATFNSFFEQGYLTCKNTNFLTQDFINKIEKFPLFPYFYNIISDTENLKIISIYNVAADNVENLEEALLSKVDIMRQKATYDLFPERIEDIIQYAYFQYAYMSTVSNLFSRDYNFRSFIFERTYRNFFNNLYSNKFCSVGEATSAGIEDSCFIPLYAVKNYLFNLMPNSCNLSNQLMLYLMYFNTYGPADQRIDNTNLSTGFTSFISSYRTTMAGELVDLIGKSLYNFTDISTLLRNELITNVKTKLSQLPAIFTTYLGTIAENPIYTLMGNSIDSLYSEIGCDVLSKIYNDNDIINQVSLSNTSVVEENLFSSFMNNINSSNIETYLFISYLYKFHYPRFINVLPLCLKEYTQNVIKSSDIDGLTLLEYSTIINKLYDPTPIDDPSSPGEYLFPQSDVNYNNLRTFLVDTVKILPVNYLNTLSTTCEIPRFACMLYYLELLDNFFSTTAYETYVQELLEEFFIYLRDQGHVEYNFNWYDYHEVVDIYLKTFMRYKIISNTSGTRLFQNVTDNFNNAFTRVITNSTHLYDPFPPFGTYDIVIDFPTASDMNSLFENMVSGTSMERMHQFSENMFLSVLTREIIYGAFTYFIT